MFLVTKNTSLDIKTGFPITQAVVDGTQQGTVYAFKDSFFVVHKSGFCSLIEKSACLEQLVFLFRQKEIPQYFHLYDADYKLIDHINQYQDLFNNRIKKRVQLEYRNKNPSPILDVNGFYIKNIMESNFDSLSVFNLDLGQRFWNNKVECINNSMGIVVFNKDHEPVSICYASAIGDGKAEVDVLTLEKYRGKRLAQFAVASFIDNSIKNDITPNWDCFEDNYGSLKTAMNVGFSFVKSYYFLSIFNKEKDHETI